MRLFFMVDIKNIVLGIAIFILTIAVAVYGISTLYGKGPQYDDFCPNNLINASICIQEGGTWANNTQLVADARGNTKPVLVEGGYCQYDYTACQKEFEDAERVYQRNVFFIALPLGIVVIALGAMIFGLESVGAGLMAGGIGIIIYGGGGFWRFADDWLKFVISLVGLVAVVWLSYYFNMKWRKNK